MKLMSTFRQQIKELGELKRVWLTTFNLDIAFVENWVLPAILKTDPPISRMDYEGLQQALTDSGIDFRIYCDPRMLAKEKPKRTSIAIYPVSVRGLARSNKTNAKRFHDTESLFHPKVFYLENEKGEIIVGAGSANLTLSGWGRNVEAVDFRRVASNEQYQQIKTFFTQLDEGLGKEFQKGRTFCGKDKNWSFIHSLGGETLRKALEKEGKIETLSVWSPYLSGDLARFINAFSDPELKIELVPDLLQGCIRTPWSESTQELIESGRLGFYSSPVLRDERTVMVHAKLWLAKSQKCSRLATGSWNFTVPGFSSLDDTFWNVEAGIVHPVSRSVTLCGNFQEVTSDNFASDELLSEEDFAPPLLPPFDLDVSFDWTTCQYSITGQWFSDKPTESYQLILPGVREPQTLLWTVAAKELKRMPPLFPTHSDVLLSSHFYTIRCKDQPDWQGIITETGTAHRRGMRFNSLDDLLSSYVSASGVTAHDNLLPRDASTHDSAEVREPTPESISPTSYFRLFHAMQQRLSWLLQVKDVGRLYRSLFSDPDCLLELVEKTAEVVEQKPDSVFSWFLACEVNNLVKAAKKHMNKLRQAEKNASVQVTKHMWSKLHVQTPVLKGKPSSRVYLDIIREECCYGR